MYILVWLLLSLNLGSCLFQSALIFSRLNYVKLEQFGDWLLIEERNGGLDY